MLFRPLRRHVAWLFAQEGGQARFPDILGSLGEGACARMPALFSRTGRNRILVQRVIAANHPMELVFAERPRCQERFCDESEVRAVIPIWSCIEKRKVSDYCSITVRSVCRNFANMLS